MSNAPYIPGSEAEQIAEIFRVIEGGVEKAAGEIVEFPVDKLPAGTEVLEGVTETVELGNGAVAEVSQLTVETGAAAETAGIGLLTMPISTGFFMAAAPILGVVAGTALYDLNPEFWTSLSNQLVAAGETIGGKVRAFLNADTGQVGVTETALNILKNLLIDAGIYETVDQPEMQADYAHVSGTNMYYGDSFDWRITKQRYDQITVQPKYEYIQYMYEGSLHQVKYLEVLDSNNNVVATLDAKMVLHPHKVLDGQGNPIKMLVSMLTIPILNYANHHFNFVDADGTNSRISSPSNIATYEYDNNGYATLNIFKNVIGEPTGEGIINYPNSAWDNLPTLDIDSNSTGCLIYERAGIEIKDPPLIPDSVPPSRTDPIPVTYPNYQPWVLPQEVPLPDVYPVEIPAVNPNPSQEEAQNPESIPEIITDPTPDLPIDPGKIADFLLDNLPLPNPNPNPQPEPVPEPDPDPQPQPEPSEPLPDIEPAPNPPQPKPVIPAPGLPIVPPSPETVPSNALFTVYNPTISQLNALGGWLWSSSIIEILMKMWQNPLEGIIGLQKVYATPTTGSTQNIILGYLDTNVSSKVVANQFETIDCGSVDVPELKYNATDYPPYVSLELYLPFIGIVELDGSEFMNGSIHIVYHVDMYTGACLAEVRSTRSPDLNEGLLYTFAGNAAQQIPLSSSNFAGAIGALISTIGGGVAIAAGGGVAGIAGGMAIGQSLTHEMIHVSRSGSISSNSGIMGPRKPALMISRRANYDANMYSEQYGYPANTTVYLGNCSGYVRIKHGHFQGTATEAEKNEIYEMLKTGVIM